MTRLTQKERDRIILGHPEMASPQLAKLVGVSKRQVQRDRRRHAEETDPDISIAFGDDAIGNLKAHRQRLELSLKATKAGSEVHRKLMKDISNLEIAIARLVAAQPAATDVEYLFIAVADPDGIARCQHISRLAPERQAEIRAYTADRT